ncbi:hypothetical protein NOF04DRAFT_11813 [Fusarium oxysporum II5]|nr:uncharacterized protein FOIG_02394 [Fusarium odoratissimum NRRL 54006]EXM07383.1 hypothetical protein FOIG_02394 [Fusarium odoratissimum NRRL 54006]KAK2130662.1 hypothetical protein NOF04DRAFT_11813 [Fusarium oxysporum II5]TXC10382.1 hypothetical protein FocTR4_00004505 [Fusarium oxysporum f. sp. cubense]
MKVSGSCRMDYSWATRRKSPVGYTWDTYYPWGEKETNQSFSVATELSPSYRLDFVTWLHPDIDKTRFAYPMMTHVSMAAGVATVKTYVGSASGAYIDAGASSLVGDMTRLILASYLSSRQIFQEIVLMPRPSPNSPSILDAAVGKLLDGARDFVVRTDEAVAMRLDLLIIAPTLLALLWLAVGALELLKRKDIWRRFGARAGALSATQLFRQLDEHLSGHDWTGTTAAIPQPSVEDSGLAIDVSESACMPKSNSVDSGCKEPSITFTTIKRENVPERRQVEDLEAEAVEQSEGAVRMELLL